MMFVTISTARKPKACNFERKFQCEEYFPGLEENTLEVKLNVT